MFKKSFTDVKTSAPLRGSERRKLRQRILQSFSTIQPEEGDVLVPEGLQTQKFTTHLDEPGVAYLSPEGNPLWFAVGKGSEDLIPTVYTLWKRPDLLPFLSTPAPVIPKLIGGADLMIPGVVQHAPGLVAGQLVAVCQYHRDALGPPLAVGRLAVSPEVLQDEDAKGKAVYVLHTWKDALWDMGPGKKTDVPAPRTAATTQAGDDTSAQGAQAEAGEPSSALGEAQGQEESVPTTDPAADVNDPSGIAQVTNTASSSADDPPKLSPEDISQCLRSSVLQAISTVLSDPPASTFPMPASTFWSAYVLPMRPAYILSSHDASAVDAKHSTHKSVKTFLKACGKEGLIKLKESKGDVVVTGTSPCTLQCVFPAHPAVAGHQPHRTVKDIETKIQKTDMKERMEKAAEEKRKGEIQVTELWKPFGKSVPLFVSAEKDTSELYSATEIKTIVNAFITSHNLVNANEQQYVNVSVNESLLGAVSGKGDTPEFLKREEVLSRLRSNMQSWHEIAIEGEDVVRKKGEPKPVSVIVKMRAGRKACTLITGFEQFSLNADDLAEELRKLCASATSVTPLPGKAAGLEVMVQGKQIKNVADLLMARGVPKRWIDSADQTASKKK